jgi:hypothetical protein
MKLSKMRVLVYTRHVLAAEHAYLKVREQETETVDHAIGIHSGGIAPRKI